ncbi:MAG: PASTA domain-containing protein [Acidimicrobiales bacterium]
MTNYFNGGSVQGGTFPALIWKAVMDRAHTGLPVEAFPEPPTSSTTTVRPVTPTAVTVPDLFGLTVDEATAALGGTSLRLNPLERETAEYPEGTIVFQTPGSGTSVPGGSLVTVEVAVAPADEPVPEVIGLTEAEARQTLSSAGFTFSVDYETNPDSENPTPGVVWAQDPPGGSSREGVDTVHLKVNPPVDDG